MLGTGILLGGLWAGGDWLQQHGFDRWVAIGIGLLGLASLVLALWHKVNDPPEQAVAHDGPGYQPSYAVPPEALQGFGLAVMVLIGVLSLILALRA